MNGPSASAIAIAIAAALIARAEALRDEGPALLLRNEGAATPAHWIVLLLEGREGAPRDAIGARVWVTADGVRQMGEVASGRSYVSQSDLRVHFGLGSAARIEALEVQWPDGTTQRMVPPAIDRVVTIRQARSRSR